MLKRKILLVIGLAAAILVLNIRPAAADTASSVKLMVNNQSVITTTYPTYSDSTLMAPAKEFVQSLGGTFRYDSNLMTGTITLGETEMVFRLDDSVVKFNGKYIQGSASMKIINNRFMIPARFVAERLGAEAYMNTAKSTLMVFQPVNGKIIYQVMPGDSLWVISQLFKTTITSIKALNALTTDTIYVGQKLAVKPSTPLNTAVNGYTTGSATLRSGPGSGYTALGYLTANSSITITGKNEYWYKAATAKGTGYIYYSVVGITQDVADSAGDSKFFDGSITVDTSLDTITYISYTVQKGDTLWSVSQKYGIPDFELASANNISVNAYLSIGQVIRIPVHNIAVKQVPGAQYGEVLDWFKEGRYIFPIGKVGKFIDVETGRSFMAERTIGASHSDTETLTAQDSQTMKEIFGGSWTWNRRPFIIEVDGRRLAVSVAGMPHAGVDGVPFLQNIDNRSDNWGYGPNYDSIPGNGMNGHFDVYFLNSLRHADDKLDPYHQYRVLLAGGLQ